MTLGELNRIFEDVMGEADGFTVGRGKKIYWYITDSRAHGCFRIFSVDQNGKLGWPRIVKATTQVTIVYK